MSTKQFNTHDNSTDSSVTVLDNLVNANSVDDVYVYRDGDQLAIESPVQTAEFHLDDLVYVYEGHLDVFEAIFESAGEVHEFFWTPQGFEILVYYAGERHTVQFLIQEGDAL